MIFSFYDTILDMANLLGIVPQRYQALGLNRLETYLFPWRADIREIMATLRRWP